MTMDEFRSAAADQARDMGLMVHVPEGISANCVNVSRDGRIWAAVAISPRELKHTSNIGKADVLASARLDNAVRLLKNKAA